MTRPRALALALGSLVALPLLLDSPAALADEPAPAPAVAPPAPPSSGYVVAFEKPRMWTEGWSETWRLKDRGGRVVCELPCTSRVEPSSGYVVEGVALEKGDWRHNGKPFVVDTLTRPVAVDGLGAPPGSAFVAQMLRPKGSPDAALGLGVVSAIVLSAAAAVFIGAGVEAETAAQKASALILDGTILGLIGAPLAVGSLVWGLKSERAKLTIMPGALPVTPPAAPAAVQVSFSPFGVRGSF